MGKYGYWDWGIQAYGNTAGGYFGDSDSSGFAYVGSGHYGITAQGNFMGGYFTDFNSSSYAYVGYDTYKIYRPKKYSKRFTYAFFSSGMCGTTTRTGTNRFPQPFPIYYKH